MMNMILRASLVILLLSSKLIFLNSSFASVLNSNGAATHPTTKVCQDVYDNCKLYLNACWNLTVLLNCRLTCRACDDKSSCSINLKESKDAPKYYPLIVSSDGEWKDPVGTEVQKEIRLQPKEMVELSCLSTGSFDSLNGSPSVVNMSCIGKQLFITYGNRGKSFSNLNQLRCNKKINPVIKIIGLCGKNKEYILYGVGYEIKYVYKTIMKICFESAHTRTVWSKFILSYEIDTILNFKRPSTFILDSMYLKSMKNAYKRAQEYATFAKLLKSEALAAKYINRKSGDRFLSRGHLTAKSDLIWPAFQLATFRLLNVAPQWQKFNGDNWAKLEIAVHKYAIMKNTSLVVYTGTYGTLKLNDTHGKPVEMFLYPEEGNHIPVPTCFWKGVFDPINKTGVVYMGVNNVFLKSTEELLDGYLICEPIPLDPILDTIKTASKINLGYLYACCVSDVQDKLDAFPQKYYNSLNFI